MWVVGHFHLGNEIVFFMNGIFYPQCNNSFAFIVSMHCYISLSFKP